MQTDDSLWEKVMPDQVVSALSTLFARWVRFQFQSGGLPTRDFDADWRSPCETHGLEGVTVAWQPTRREVAGSLANIAIGLEVELHPDLYAYYDHWFAGPLLFLFKGLRLELTQPWNEQDYLRLQENLIGHALMLRQLRLPLTFFIAATRSEQHIISLDNASGEVLYETLGKRERRVLAPTLTQFLQRLEPLRA